MTMTLESWNEYLRGELQDPAFAAGYLEEALAIGMEHFLVSLRKYVQATGGVALCAKQTGFAREAIYRMLSEEGNPEFRSVQAFLKARGLRFSIQQEAAESLPTQGRRTSHGSGIDGRFALAENA